MDEDVRESLYLAVESALGQSRLTHHETIPSGETVSTLYVHYDEDWTELIDAIVDKILPLHRPTPTREEIAKAIHKSDLAHGLSGHIATGTAYYENADAVLALFEVKEEE